MPTDDQVQLVPERQYPLVGSGAGYSSWVHLDDGEAAVTMMTEGRGSSNAKAKRETRELRYPSWRQGFKEGLA